MKRIIFPDTLSVDVSFNNVRDRIPGDPTVNGMNRAHHWCLVLSYEGRSVHLPYCRGKGLSGTRTIDKVAVLKALFMEQAYLFVHADQIARDGVVMQTDMPANQINPTIRHNFEARTRRIMYVRDKLKYLLGAEYDTILNTVLFNLMETGRAA